MSTREIIMSASGTSSGGYFVSNLIDTTYYPPYSLDGIKRQAIVVDSSGNIYCTFSVTGSNESVSAKSYVVKYSPTGTILWQKDINTSGTTSPTCIALDSSGNPHIAGYTVGGGPNYSFVIKINSSGALQWATYTTGGYNNFADSIALDSSNNVYLFGHSTDDPNGSSGNQLLLIKLNSSGTEQWKYLLNQGGSSNRGYGIAIGSSGNVYVCSGDSGLTGLVLKVSASGSILWQSQLGTGVAANDTNLFGITTDSSENVYLCGADGNTDIFVAKYNSSGSLQWKIYLGGVSTVDVGYAVSVDSLGRVYVIGHGQTQGAIIFKLDSSGSLIWQKKFSSGGDLGALVGFGIKSDNLSNIYLYMSYATNDPRGCVIAKLPNNGYPYVDIGTWQYPATTYPYGSATHVTETTPSPLLTSIAASGSTSYFSPASANSAIASILTTF